jgi:hypothetical protein
LLGSNVLDFFTEIVIIRSSSYWVSAQCIHVHMLHPWSMHYFETEVLQHVDLAPSSSMRIRNCGKPFKRLVVSSQKEMISV